MPLSVLSLAMGFTVGVIATAIVWNLTTRSVRNPERTRLTSVWSLGDVVEGREPVRLVAEGFEGVELPEGARVIVPRGAQGSVPPGVLKIADVRIHPGVHANFCVGRARALVFAGRIHPRAQAIWTLEPAVVRHLQEEFARLWNEAEPYFEEVLVADVAGSVGRLVSLQGLASQLVEFRGRKMLKVSHGGASVGVVIDHLNLDTVYAGPVRVVGRVTKEGDALYVRADRLESADRRPARAPAPAPGAR